MNHTKLTREDLRQQNSRLKPVIQDLSPSEKEEIDQLYNTVRFARMPVEQLLSVKENPFLSKELLLEHALMRLNLIEVSGSFFNFDSSDDEKSTISSGKLPGRSTFPPPYPPWSDFDYPCLFP